MGQCDTGVEMKRIKSEIYREISRIYFKQQRIDFRKSASGICGTADYVTFISLEHQQERQ